MLGQTVRQSARHAIIATAADARKGKDALVLGRLLFHGLHNHPEILRITTYGAQGIAVFVMSA